jgi:hypothetical protein
MLNDDSVDKIRVIFILSVGVKSLLNKVHFFKDSP